MKKIFLAFAMIAGSIVANAAEIKLSKTNFEVVAGGTVIIPIQMDLESSEVDLYKTLQIDGVLSDANFTKEKVTMAVERKKAGYETQYLEQIAGKAFGLIGQKSAALIQGTSGDILYLTVKADEAVSSGDECTLTLSNFKVSVLDGTVTNIAGSLTATITVVDYVTIDENEEFTPFAITKDVKLIRSFESGKYYTLCLPFAANAAKFEEAFGTAPTLYKFSGVEAEEEDGAISRLTLKFSSSTGAAANTPYIMLAKADVASESTFKNAAIKAGTPVTSVDEEDITFASVDFKGTYAPGTVVPADGLYLKGDKLYSSKGNTKMKGTRAYFDLTALAAEMPLGIKGYVLDLDGVETSISEIDQDVKAEGWYDLNGRKLTEKPAMKGIYINNGKKVVVK